VMYQIGIVTFLRRQYKGPCMVAGARRRLHLDTAAVIGVINRKTTGDRCTVWSDDFQRHVTKVAALVQETRTFTVISAPTGTSGGKGSAISREVE